MGEFAHKLMIKNQIRANIARNIKRPFNNMAHVANESFRDHGIELALSDMYGSDAPAWDSVDPNGAPIMEALAFRYPCGLTGHEMESEPLDLCDRCEIDTDQCVEYSASAKVITENKKNGKKHMMTFDEYLTFKRNTAKARITWLEKELKKGGK